MLNTFERRKCVKQISSLIDELEGIIIEKDVKLRNKLLRKLTEALVNSYDDQRTKAINEAIDYLISVDGSTFSKKEANKINEILKQRLGEDLKTVLEKNVKDLNEKIFKSGINDVGQSLKLKLSFDVSDIEAAQILADHTFYWIESYYSDQLQADFKEILKDYYTANKTINEVASDFASQFANRTEKGFSYFEGLAEHTTYRTAELGKISGFEKAGIDFYQIKAVMDERTSELCQDMNGRIFPVSKAIEFRDGILKLKSPEEVKLFAPWRSVNDIKGKADDELPLGMAIPPYHWRCRTITVAYFGDISEDTKQTETESEVLIAGLKLKVYDFEKEFYSRNDIKFKKTTSSKYEGKFVYNLLTEAAAIWLNPNARNPLATFLHETGHALDELFLDSNSKYRFYELFHSTNKSEQIYNIVYKRLSRKFTDITLEDTKQLLTGKHIIYDGHNWKLSRKMIRYYLERDEILADAYAQFRLNDNFKDYAIDYYNYFKEILLQLKKKYGK